VGDFTGAGVVVINANLQAGNDSFLTQFIEQGPGNFSLDDNSQFHVNVRGGSGADMLEVLYNAGSSLLDVTSLLNIMLSGGAGKDILKLTTATDDDVILDGILRVKLSGDAGNDVVDFDFDLAPSADGQYDIGIFGGSGNDAVNFIGGDDGNAIARPANALLDGGLGNNLLNLGAAYDFIASNFAP
jgi:hypothetical protein